jgi:catechol 2,3-dioxygenase-like lactoylglutathione lyase family enzyme
MTVSLNHTIVWCTDKEASARFYVEILGLPAPTPFGPFLVVQLSNGVSLDFSDARGRSGGQHYAFLVSEQEFEEIYARITARQLPYWADPIHREPQQINRNDGGRGLYWDDPDGHQLEIITRPYGG